MIVKAFYLFVFLKIINKQGLHKTLAYICIFLCYSLFCFEYQSIESTKTIE